MGIRPHLALVVGLDDWQDDDDPRLVDREGFWRRYEGTDDIPVPIGIEKEYPEDAEQRKLWEYLEYSLDYGDPHIVALRVPASERFTSIGGAEITLHALAEYLGCRVGAQPWHHVFTPVKWGEGGYISRDHATWDAEHGGVSVGSRTWTTTTISWTTHTFATMSYSGQSKSSSGWASRSRSTTSRLCCISIGDRKERYHGRG